MTVAEINCYDAFGLILQSEFNLPELYPRTAPIGPLDMEKLVFIRRGEAGRGLADSRRLADWIEVNDVDCLYTFPGYCQIRVRSGQEIIVELEEGASESDMRAFLFGSALGTIAHQRRMIPLHISAIETAHGTFAFTGQSGAGKSTMVAALSKLNGWRIVCDDMACLLPEAGTLKLFGGVRRNKLWADAISHLSMGERPMHRDIARADKFHIEIEDSGLGSFGPVSSFFQLEWADEAQILPLSSGRSYAAVMNSVYRPYLVPVFNDLETVRTRLAEFTDATPCYRLLRPKSFDRLSNVSRQIEEHMQTT